ncbi:MAG: phenylalanine--tRNA ligase subunit beta [Victivallaceae bacterium]|nr:phenylalanine--tRNA ligase subunit beta [Victivallaceae bacterium]
MNISREWLSQYVALNCDDATLCRKLTTAGIEVEKVESDSTVPAGVVAARILDRQTHPNSDHLSVCQVTDGTETLQIVCGAPNCDAGKIVPLAKIGTVFHTPEGDFKIKKSKLRGVESSGMMCSAAELGISDDNSGLMILDESVAPGTSVADLYRGDTRIEVEVTPNRPDWLSMYGIARDVSCLLNEKARLPEVKLEESSVENNALVTVEAPDLCPRYIGRLIRNVKIAPSPAWLVRRLESVGLRAINNVVDVTNFVMMELGQPLHAFDLAKLSGGRVIARRAKAGEKITTLDGREFTLSSDNLVIADDTKPMALAGIMGGENSCVSDTTTDILLESAVFNASNIRFSSRRLGISTDASYRYERGVDFDMAEFASRRAAQLILETAGGSEVCAPCEKSAGRPEEPVIVCRFERIRKLIGTPTTNEEMVDIFRKLHLKVDEISENSCRVTAPLFRLDLTREADLAEEVARINGLDQVPEIPVKGTVCHPVTEDAYRKLKSIRDAVIDAGFTECVNYSIIGNATALSDGRFEESDLVKLANPLSPEVAVMRPSLFGTMLGTVERNIAHGNRELALFEFGKAFCANAQKFPEERFELMLLLSGHPHAERFSAEAKVEYDFFDIKGEIEALFARFGITRYRFVKLENDNRFEKGFAAKIEIDGKTVGAVGKLAEKFVTWRNASGVYFAQIEAQAFFDAERYVRRAFKALPQFPASNRDIAMLAPAALSHAEITDFIRRCRVENLESVKLFDIFSDEKLARENLCSMAYTLTFRRSDRTLTDAEINQAVDKLRERLEKELKLTLR